MIINIYYLGEPVNIYIQSLISIIQENNWVITKKKGNGKLPLFCGNGEWVNPIYDFHARAISHLQEDNISVHKVIIRTYVL